MKATQVAKRIVEITGKPTNAEALEAIEATLKATGERQPFGATVIADPITGQVTPAIFGVGEKVTSEKLRGIQGVLRLYADNLDQTITELIKAEARAQYEGANGTEPDIELDE